MKQPTLWHEHDPVKWTDKKGVVHRACRTCGAKL